MLSHDRVACVTLQPLRLVAVCLLLFSGFASGVSGAATEPTGEDEIDLAEIVRKPEYGNYRGYAEFKMAHYA
jgi:hypothetical protein